MAKLVFKKHCDVCKRKIHSGWFEKHLKSKGHLSKLNPDARAYVENPFPDVIPITEEQNRDFRLATKEAFETGYNTGVREAFKIFKIIKDL